MKNLRIVVSSPYREGSIVNIATAAERLGMLEFFYTTLYTPNLAKHVEVLPVIGSLLKTELGRRAFKGIPAERVKGFAGLEELVRIAAYRGATNLFDFPAAFMYWVKDRFDEAAARDLRSRQVDAVVGMWGSCSRTFAAAGKDCIKVLNMVNSRPHFHNQYLRDQAGLSDDNAEMISPRVSALVETEIALADLILVPSTFAAKQFEDCPEKVVLARYGVNLSEFSPGEAAAQYRCNVLSLGQISYRKGFTNLIEAANRLPHRTFSAVGPMVVQKLVKHLPTNMKYSGLVLHGEVSAVMRSADIFVLASFEDTFALVVVEAMASGTPVIVSDHAGVAELVTHGVDGFIYPAGDVDALTNYIEQIAGNPGLRRSMGEAARTKVAASHSWDEYSSQVLQAIHDFRR